MKLVSRSEWGARPPRYSLAYIASTQGVKIHYEGAYVAKSLAEPAAHTACAGHMRDIQLSHLNNKKENYSDIAYNAVVCPHGYVFEGRGTHRRTGANGNQSLNLQDYAVCTMLGNSGLVQPTDAMLDGVVDAVEWLRSSGDAGSRVLGHRDGWATACPGEPLYTWVTLGARRPGGTPPTGPGPGTPDTARYQVEINGLKYGYGAKGAHVTAVGAALVKEGFGHFYQEGPGPLWTDADTKAFSAWQLSLGYKGTAPHQDADGVPGPVSLRKLLGTLPGVPESSTPPYPGRSAFVMNRSNPAVTVLDNGLVKKGFVRHAAGDTYIPGPLFTEFTRRNVADFQRSVKALAGDPDGYPGPLTWQYLLT